MNYRSWLQALKTRESTTPIENGNHNFWRGLAIPAFAGKTFTWYPSDSAKNYRQVPGQVYEPDTFEYKFNAHGYRCDEFDLTGPSLCFTGCSMTMGVGLPVEDTWSWRFKEMVEEVLGHPIIYWNLSHGAKSMTWMRRTLYLSREVIDPDFMIAFLPDGNRDELYGSNILSDICYPHMPMPPEDVPGFVRMMSEEQAAGKMAHTLSAYDMALRGSNTGFAWGHWASTKIVNLAFDRFTGGRFDANRFYANINHEPADTARDMMHPGPVMNKMFAKALFREIGHRVVTKLKENHNL